MKDEKAGLYTMSEFCERYGISRKTGYKWLLEVRRKHPSWGPRKILAWLEARHPRTTWPAASSVGALLRREGLVAESRRRPRREPHPGPPQIAAKEPNDL